MTPSHLLRRPILSSALLACSLGLASAKASADQSSAETMAAARALGIEGIRLAEAGDCARAVDKLSRAEALHHAPTTLGRLGECHVTLGHLVEGTEILQRVVREPLPPAAPPAFTAAHTRAQHILTEALPHIGKLRIHVTRHSGNAAFTVTVDGEPLAEVLLDAEFPADPGSHVIEVSAPTHITDRKTITLANGETRDVKLLLKPDPDAVPPPPTAPAETTAAQPTRSSAVPGLVLAGAGGATLIVGTAFGIAALSVKGKLNDACVPKSNCPPSSQSNIDALNRDSIISTVGITIGAAATVGGVLWVLLRPHVSAPAQTTASRIHLEPLLGLGSAGVRGSF